MSILKKIFFLFTFFLFLLILVFAFWLMYQRTRDPVAALNKGIIYPRLLHIDSRPVELVHEGRIYDRVVLYSEEIDSIALAISRPVEVPAEGLPVLIILGGMESGEDNFKYFTGHGSNILLAYNYPPIPPSWKISIGLSDIPEFNDRLMKIPAQVEATARWALGQSWSDRSRISVLAFSYGAFIAPAVYDMAESHQLKLGPAVLAYGGVDLYNLMYRNLESNPTFVKTVSTWMAARAIYPLEPSLHLPQLQGEFLVISARRDQFIEEKYWQKYQELTASPKTVIIKDTGHPDLTRPELIVDLVQTSRKWLMEKEAINP